MNIVERPLGRGKAGGRGLNSSGRGTEDKEEGRIQETFMK